MKKSIRKIGVLTSGGDAPGMNAAIRAVVRASVYHNLECTGIYRGYEGLIEGDFKNLNARSVKNIINRGGTLLKSARSKEFFLKEGRLKAYNNLKNEEVSVSIGMGAYIVSVYKGNGMIYNKLETRYSISNRLFLRMAMKTHIAVADFVEYGVGYSF